MRRSLLMQTRDVFCFFKPLAAVRERRRRKIIKREEEERFYCRGVVRHNTFTKIAFRLRGLRSLHVVCGFAFRDRMCVLSCLARVL